MGTAASSMVLGAAAVLTPEGLLTPGWVALEGDRISAVGRGGTPYAATDLGDVTLVPGFVDLHGHGGGGASYADGPDGARTVIATHRRHGTTSMLASLVTDRLDALAHQIGALAPLVDSGDLLGLHLEGPWLSHLHCGAHDPDLLRDPAPADIDRLLDAGGGAVRMVTLAVERDGGPEAVARLTGRGVIAALGHSHATYEQANAAIDVGARVATHLYNAERPVHHREPGLVLALLDREEAVVELIADGVHVHPAMLRHAARHKAGRFMLVTDAMAAAGACDGNYTLGPLEVEVRDGVARLAHGGAIAGSTLTMDRAIAYTVQVAGLGLHEAVTAATTTPADVLGRSDLGRLAPGARADLVVLDPSLRVRRVMRGGAWVPTGVQPGSR